MQQNKSYQNKQKQSHRPAAESMQDSMVANSASISPLPSNSKSTTPNAPKPAQWTKTSSQAAQ